MLFLHAHGVGTSRAVRIFKTYGQEAVPIISENPYRLARDIRGIGFLTADKVAEKLGIEKTAMIRVRAGVSYALAEAMDEGHCGLPVEELTTLTARLIEVPPALIDTALALELRWRRPGRRHGRGTRLRVPGRALSGRAGHCRAFTPPGVRSAALAGDRCRQSGPLGGRQNRSHPGGQPKAGPRLGRRLQGAGDHRRAGCGQDHAGERDPEGAPGQGCYGCAVRAHRTGGQTAGREHRPGGMDHSSAAGGRSEDGRFQAQSKPIRLPAICWWWTRPAWWTCR